MTVKEELEYYPIARPNTNLVRMARLLANQLEQAQRVEVQIVELQAQIVALTARLKD